jgi:hypothetical protein
VSAFGSLLVALTALIALGAIAAYLVNVPLWAVIGGSLISLAVLYKVAVHRSRRGSPRQDQESAGTK